MVHGDRSSVGWTLILWDIENVPVPDQLRTPAGIKQVKTILRDKFAKSRELQLHCIKLACRWPDHRSPYADLLGWLTTLGDVEALGYQWQGQKDKSHNADRLLKQAADRFMHMLELHNGPEHLVVFITSDQDFGEKIQELQRRNFKVAVIYNEPHASKRPASIIHVADESYDWLEFLAKELKASKLMLSPYDASVTQPGTSAAPTLPTTPAKAEVRKAIQEVKASREAPSAKQPAKKQSVSDKVCKNSNESMQPCSSVSSDLNQSNLNETEQACGNKHTGSLQILEAGQKLLDAIARSLPIETHWFKIVVAAACLQNGFSSCSHGYQLVPVSCCTIGAAVKQNCPHIPGKLKANLQKCQQFFKIIPGPAGTQPAVLLVLTAMIDKPYSKAVAKILNQIHSSSEHPSNGKHLIGCDSASKDSAGSDAPDKSQDFEAAQKLSDVIAETLPLDAHEFAVVVAAACLHNGFSSCSHGYQLVPVSCCTIGAVVKEKCPHIPGKLQANLQKCQQFFKIIPGPAGSPAAVLPVLTTLIERPYCLAVAKILDKVHSSSEHPSSGKQFAGFETASEGSLDSESYTCENSDTDV